MNTALGYLGNIPNGWKLVHLGRLTSEVKALNSNCSETNALQFKMGNIISKSTGDSKYHPETLEGYTIVAPGDVVVNGLNLNYDLKSLRVGQVCQNAVITSAYIIVRPEKIDADYFKYLLKGFDSIKTFHGMGKGIRLTLGYEELRRMYIPVPSPAEQSRIAAFLDERCAKIDEAVARHKALIEKLDEYRKAVITKAVTKGVRGEREMKESGVDWIGKIPSDWSMQKMLWMCRTITDYVASGSFADLADNVTYRDAPDYAMLIRTTDISNKGASLKHVYVDKHSYDFLSNSNLFGGEVVLPNVGSIGEAYIVPNLYERMTLGPNAIVVRASQRSNDRFLYYFFNSYAGSISLINLAQVTTQPKFNKTNFRAMRGICPPPEEQSEIVDFLDKKCAAIDSAKERHQQLIIKLEEYKKSLIYNAVTGKIEC